MKGDVQTAVRVTGHRSEFSASSDELFHIARLEHGGNRTLAAVGFQLLGHQIAVMAQTVRAALHRGSCMLTDDDGPCFELWECSRAALEDLLFG